MRDPVSKAVLPTPAGDSNTAAQQRGMRGWFPALLVLGLLALFVATARGSSADQRITPPPTPTALAKLPLSFVENQGQADVRVKFQSRGPGFHLGILPDGAILRLAQALNGERSSAHGAFSPRATAAKAVSLRMRLLNAHAAPKVSGREPLAGKVNFLRGSDAQRWVTGAPLYGQVQARGIYPGIDLVYYGNRRQLEYDFVVAPGADPGQIRLAFSGQSRMELTSVGDLVLHTGRSQLRQSRPVVYQEIEGKRHLVAGEYQQVATNQVAFRLGAYDRRHSLVIDPVLAYSTYLGGSGDDFGTGIATDEDGNIYVTGATLSDDFPLKSPGQEEPGSQQAYDAFVTKLSPDGGSLIYSTYLGGQGEDGGSEIALDSSGNAYVTGTTSSADFPTTTGAFDRARSGLDDAFVTKLNASGSALLYSTYLGGSSTEQAFGIAVDGEGNAYATGSTQSANYPTTTEAFDRNANGFSDVYVAKLGVDGKSLVYSTFLGSTGFEYGSGIAVARNGEACVTGSTQSLNFPTTEGAFDRGANGGWDAFVARLEADGSGLIYSTFLGGRQNDEAFGLALDPDGKVAVIGETASTEFPTTEGALDRSWNSGLRDAFVALLHADGSRLDYSTYLGGRSEDSGIGIAADVDGLLYATGFTGSVEFPLAGAVQKSRGGLFDAFVAKIDPTKAGAASLPFSTYLGGRDNESGLSLIVDDTGTMTVTGETLSANFPTLTPLQAANEGISDLFITRISDLAPLGTPTNLTAVAASVSRIDLEWRDNSSAESSFEIQRKTGNGTFSRIAVVGANIRTYADSGLTISTTYTYRVRAVNRRGNSGFSNDATATTQTGAPNRPTVLTATAESGTEVQLSWRDNSNDETSFGIERKTGAGSFTEIERTDPNATEFLDTGLTPDTEYIYRVRAFKGDVASSYSNEASARTDPEPPAVPEQLTAEGITTTRIELAWQDRSNNEKSFEVERKQGTAAFQRVATLNADTTSYTDNGLSIGAEYTYRVRAVNDGGASAYSNEATASTLPPPPPPAAPSQLAATAQTSERVALTWRDNSNNEKSFHLERKRGTGAFVFLVTLPANATGHFDRTVLPNTTYTYRVRARNDGGESAYSNEATATTPALPAPPNAPSNLAATALSASSIRLTWTDASNNEERFEIERRIGDGGFTQLATPAANATSYQDSGLAANTLYRYRVRAVNAGGASAFSNEAGTLTLPVAPTQLRVTARSATQLDLTWADSNPNPAAHRVERSADGGRNFTQIAAVAAGRTNYQDAGLTANTTYHYRVRAANSSGFSAYSAVVSGSTQAPLGGRLEVVAQVNFGKVKVRKRGIRTLAIRNVSTTQALQVQISASSAPFTVEGGARTVVIAPRQAEAVVLTFRPTARRTYNRNLSLRSSDSTRPTARVKLTGRGK